MFSNCPVHKLNITFSPPPNILNKTIHLFVKIMNHMNTFKYENNWRSGDFSWENLINQAKMSKIWAKGVESRPRCSCYAVWLGTAL